MKFKKIIRPIHLWLGLTTGIIVIIVALTGCLYAFQEEIQDLTESYRFVSPQHKPQMMPSTLERTARETLPGKQLHSILFRSDKNRAAEAIFYDDDPLYHFKLYMNPYDGTVLEVVDMESGFFHFILDGHFYLWLPPTIGRPVVASVTLLFFIMMMTGLILWMPKTIKRFKKVLWFRWKKHTPKAKKNHDLHGILGFYTTFVALIFVATGLVWGFDIYASTYYKAFGGEKSLLYEAPLSIEKTKNQPEEAIDKVWIIMKKLYPQAKYIEVHPPESSTATIMAAANLATKTYWETDYRYFDQYTLEEKEVDNIYGKLINANTADKVLRMNYDIHTGAILGIGGKILAFFFSLLIASLPITGFIIYVRKQKKRKRRVIKI